MDGKRKTGLRKRLTLGWVGGVGRGRARVHAAKCSSIVHNLAVTGAEQPNGTTEWVG